MGYAGSVGVTLNIQNATLVPASPGNAGQIAWDENFLYVCIDVNSWIRIGNADQSITTW
jgi:hypothetical protein